MRSWRQGAGCGEIEEVAVAKAAPIVETVVTGEAPAAGMPGAPASGGGERRVSRISANPLLEYVAGGSYAWTASFLRSLPFAIDDVTRDFGDDLYERMLLDPQVASSVNTVKMGVLSSTMRLLPAGDSPIARAACDFCSRCLDELETPLYTVLWNLLDGLALGNKVAEQVYAIRDSRLALAALKVKPRRATAFVTDVYLNLVGVLGLIPGQGAPVLVEGLIGEPARTPHLLPRSKFLVFTFRQRDGDPRGQSILRPAYSAWFLKTQMWQEYLKYLTQFAGPSLIGFTPEEAQQTVQTDSLGNIQTDANGSPIYLNPEQAMLAALQTFRNGTAAVFPFGSRVEPLQMAGDGGAFLQAIGLFNSEIDRAVTGQTLATQEGEHQSRAASAVHQDVLGLVVRAGKHALETALQRDVLRPLTVLNFGGAAADLTPRPTLADTESQDFADTAASIAALQTSGYLAASQYAALDAMLGLPERKEEPEQI
ncbi:MAG: DUF935 family protein [Armatimonadetes bacterium]|nr:DUF935 family protein [Armatimonadota bacterium]MDE2206283.1 DUF935 family protein [Armatimonadota bacterium]